MLPLEVIELPDGDYVKWSNRNLVGFSGLAVASSQLDQFQL